MSQDFITLHKRWSPVEFSSKYYRYERTPELASKWEAWVVKFRSDLSQVYKAQKEGIPHITSKQLSRNYYENMHTHFTEEEINDLFQQLAKLQYLN